MNDYVLMCAFRLVKRVLYTILEMFIMRGQKQSSGKLETLVVVLLMYRNCYLELLNFMSKY